MMKKTGDVNWYIGRSLLPRQNKGHDASCYLVSVLSYRFLSCGSVTGRTPEIRSGSLHLARRRAFVASLYSWTQTADAKPTFHSPPLNQNDFSCSVWSLNLL